MTYCLFTHKWTIYINAYNKLPKCLLNINLSQYLQTDLTPYHLLLNSTKYSKTFQSYCHITVKRPI